SAPAGLSEKHVTQFLTDGEGPKLEFKSTAFCDMQGLRMTPPQLTRSDGVVHSALKTICAFLNSDGGTLIVGVTDTPAVCGFDSDLKLLNCGQDGWETELRNLIQGRFINGRLINS